MEAKITDIILTLLNLKERNLHEAYFVDKFVELKSYGIITAYEEVLRLEGLNPGCDFSFIKEELKRNERQGI